MPNKRRYFLNPITIKKAVDKLGSQAAVARKFGIDQSTLCAFCIKHKIGTRNAKMGKRRNLPMAKIHYAFTVKKIKMGELAKLHNITTTGLRNKLQAFDQTLKFKKIESKFNDLPLSEIKTLYQKRLKSFKEIAELYKTSSNTIQRRLLEKYPTLKLRSRSERRKLQFKHSNHAKVIVK